MPLDKWTILDIVSGFISVVCFNYTGRLTADMIIDKTQKQTVDSYVAIVVVISWIRYFGYFLVIKSVSKLINTLVKMLKDTISFMFIMISYMLLVSSIFSTLFQEASPERYGSLSSAMRTMFDYALGNYDTQLIDYKNDSHSALMMIHIVISNIFLLNYLIAILSTVYITMRVIGEFLYKANRYYYIEKFQLPRLDDKGLEQYVINPAPINLLTIGLIPFTLNAKGVRYGKYFSRMIFWIENMIMSILFAVYLAILIPIIYFRVFLHLLISTKWYQFLAIGIFWILFGLIILPVYSLMDLVYFYKINCDEGQVDKTEDEKLKKELKARKLIIYNEIYSKMKNIYM